MHTHARARLAPAGGWDLARSRVFSQCKRMELDQTRAART